MAVHNILEVTQMVNKTKLQNWLKEARETRTEKNSLSWDLMTEYLKDLDKLTTNEQVSKLAKEVIKMFHLEGTKIYQFPFEIVLED